MCRLRTDTPGQHVVCPVHAFAGTAPIILGLCSLLEVTGQVFPSHPALDVWR